MQDWMATHETQALVYGLGVLFGLVLSVALLTDLQDLYWNRRTRGEAARFTRVVLWGRLSADLKRRRRGAASARWPFGPGLR
jgi:hypothetical protein